MNKSFLIFCLVMLTSAYASAQKDSSGLYKDFSYLKSDIMGFAGNEDQFRQPVVYNGKKVSAIWAISETTAQIAPGDTILYIRISYFVAKDSLVSEDYFATNRVLTNAGITRMASMRDPELPADAPPMPRTVGELNYYFENGRFLTRYTEPGTLPQHGWETPEAAVQRFEERFLAIKERLQKKTSSK